MAVIAGGSDENPPKPIQAWFIGMNPDLDDQAPALLLHEDPHAVLGAARNFLAYG